MIEEVGEPVRKCNRQMEHPVETLKALPEDALRAVAVRLEFDPGQRREFASAISAEVERLRDGVISAEEWQRLNPGALGAKEALF